MGDVYVPSGSYKIGQIIKVAGKNMKLESYTHTGRSVTVVSMPNAVRFERIVCLVEGDVPRTYQGRTKDAPRTHQGG